MRSVFSSRPRELWIRVNQLDRKGVNSMRNKSQLLTGTILLVFNVSSISLIAAEKKLEAAGDLHNRTGPEIALSHADFWIGD